MLRYAAMLSTLIWIGTFFVAALIVGVLAFYSLKETPRQQEQSPAAVAEHSTNKLRLDIPKTPIAAPDFQLKDPAEKQVSIKEFRGKVVFLNFWATWCAPCVEEMPAIEKLHRELETDGLVVLAVNFQEGPNRVKEFFTKHKLTFTPLMDRDGKVAELYQAWALPVSIIINKRGEIAGKAMGARDWDSDESIQLFRKLIAEEM